jgi:hypothetical protein
MGRRVSLITVLLLVLFVSAIPVSAARLEGSQDGGRPFSVGLTPEDGLPSQVSEGSGLALLTLNQKTGGVCFDITVDALTSPVFSAHIHRGAKGVNGPIVVGLFTVTPTTAERFTGCVTAPSETIHPIMVDPAGHYVNVHTLVFPNGEVRGQLR